MRLRRGSVQCVRRYEICSCRFAFLYYYRSPDILPQFKRPLSPMKPATAAFPSSAHARFTGRPRRLQPHCKERFLSNSRNSSIRTQKHFHCQTVHYIWLTWANPNSRQITDKSYSTDVFLRDMFLNFLLCYFKYDSVLKSVFYSRSDAVSNVCISFNNYVTA